MVQQMKHVVVVGGGGQSGEKGYNLKAYLPQNRGKL